jgi:antagonist of KipI
MSNYFLQVLRPGINTTFQDKGRFHMQHLGVTPGGCMDLSLFSVANSLVGNSLDEGVLEFAYQGPLMKLIKGKTKVAVTGSVYFKIIKSNKKVIDGECNRTYFLNEGDQIDLLATKNSAYGYMALKGGFNLKSFCNSTSTLARAKIGPNQGKKLKLDDIINFKINNEDEKNFFTNITNNLSSKIRVLQGPQFDYFSKESQKDFFSKEYKISNLTDRMGMRLEGNNIKNIYNTNIRSEGITKGAIQVPADGQPIILLTDFPTIGGYPKIANVASVDYNLLVQKTPGEKIFFELIKLHEAEQLYKEHLNNISNIIKNIKEIN